MNNERRCYLLFAIVVLFFLSGCCAFFYLWYYRYMFILFVYEVLRLGYIQKKITCLKRYNWYKHDE